MEKVERHAREKRLKINVVVLLSFAFTLRDGGRGNVYQRSIMVSFERLVNRHRSN